MRYISEAYHSLEFYSTSLISVIQSNRNRCWVFYSYFFFITIQKEQNKNWVGLTDWRFVLQGEIYAVATP